MTEDVVILAAPVKRKRSRGRILCPSCGDPIKRGRVAVAVLTPEMNDQGDEVLRTHWAHQRCVEALEALEPTLFAGDRAVAS